MSFFSFGQDPQELQADAAAASGPGSVQPVIAAAPAKRITLDDELLSKKLTVIAEPVVTSAGTLYKRNAADVKFDIADGDDMEGENLLAQAILSQTDLIPGRYEGGLKTWECATDVIEYLSSLGPEALRGKRVMELGSGSSLPGIYCLGQGAIVDLQDYNEEVLHLVTIPNVLINATVTSAPVPAETHESGTTEVDVDYAKLSELPVRFWSGDWGLLKNELQHLPNEEKYDMILTAETIYAAESHDKLLDVIKAIIKPSGIVYIAAKTTYFGCSGSLAQFLQLVRQRGCFASIETVWVETRTVRREIVKLTF
ncbi:Histidine protein methyltransferase 1 [Geranomyces variabilis]|uniref:protein-histidine N-methyltransferase n=1 Tax=Geranomyces variabilis TaxID=109894 RepID=A0AAD5TK63_9FUNG|nr:Histidine protein methyltransferase 1 [Geranomyces variabilis]